MNGFYGTEEVSVIAYTRGRLGEQPLKKTKKKSHTRGEALTGHGTQN